MDSFPDAEISAELKRVHPNGSAKCRWGRLNTGAVAENWRLLTRSVYNLVRSQVYHSDRPPCLFAARRASLSLIADPCYILRES